MLMGCILVANALPELPAFFFFGSILAALGMNTVLLAACATLGLRVWAYSVGTCWYHYVVPLVLLIMACTAGTDGRGSARGEGPVGVPGSRRSCLTDAPPLGPAPPQLLPSINLNWIVAIETLHAVTYACGWSGEEAVLQLVLCRVCRC